MGQQIIRSLQLGNVWFEERQGGLARVYYELFKNLPATGVEVRGLVIGSKQIEERHHGHVRGFALANQPMLQRLSAARRSMHQILKEQNFDLVASHFALYTAPVLDQIRNLPLVVHFHGPWAAEGDVEGNASLRSRMQALMETSVYKRAARFIVLSRAFQKDLVERYRIQEDRVRIIPGGVDSLRFNTGVTRAEARARLGWPVNRPIVLAVRRLVNRMGLEDLIDATRDLILKTPDLQVFIGGVGVLATELQQRIDSQNLGDNVRLLGRIEDDLLPLAYRAADISIVPTVALEGFGMITLESLASGTPVLVTPVGGLPEVVAGLAPELILEGTGAAAIASRLGDFLRGQIQLPGEVECRNYAVSGFTWALAAERTRQVYMEALSSSRSS